MREPRPSAGIVGIINQTWSPNQCFSIPACEVSPRQDTLVWLRPLSAKQLLHNGEIVIPIGNVPVIAAVDRAAPGEITGNPGRQW